ncbi:MAG: phage major capsid protein [Elioraea tepidiphila]
MGLERFLLTLFGQAIGWFEEYSFLQGDGVGKPLGILNSPAAISVSSTSLPPMPTNEAPASR